jgi:hypothetical protein
MFSAGVETTRWKQTDARNCRNPVNGGDLLGS